MRPALCLAACQLVGGEQQGCRAGGRGRGRGGSAGQAQQRAGWAVVAALSPTWHSAVCAVLQQCMGHVFVVCAAMPTVQLPPLLLASIHPPVCKGHAHLTCMPLCVLAVTRQVTCLPPCPPHALWR